MKRNRGKRPDQPEIPGMRAWLAAQVAEALVTHTHRCAVRIAAEHLLEVAGLSEAEFLLRWSAGAYDD